MGSQLVNHLPRKLLNPKLLTNKMFCSLLVTGKDDCMLILKLRPWKNHTRNTSAKAYLQDILQSPSKRWFAHLRSWKYHIYPRVRLEYLRRNPFDTDYSRDFVSQQHIRYKTVALAYFLQAWSKSSSHGHNVEKWGVQRSKTTSIIEHWLEVYSLKDSLFGNSLAIIEWADFV